MIIYYTYNLYWHVQGIDFIDALSRLCYHRNVSAIAINPECIKWLNLLVGLIDIMGDCPDVHFKMFLRHTGVVNKYRPAIAEQVRV